MGTVARIRVVATDRSAALAASETALAELQEVEARLSTWHSDSELSRLNHRPADGEHVMSPELAEDLATVRWCWQMTQGAFDPTVGALVDAWGLRTGGRVPTRREIAAAREASGMERLSWRAGSIRRPNGLRLEEGGFGKGSGLRAVMRALASDPKVISAELDLGGQLAYTGESGPWTVSVAAPNDRTRPVVALTLDAGSLATSGNSERGLEIAGRRYSHLLDPRTGHPTEDFGSLTVWTADPLQADCLATGLYVLGPDAALEWAEANSGVEVLVLESRVREESTRPGRIRVRATTGLRHRLRPLDEQLTVLFPEPPAPRPHVGLQTSLQ